MTTPLLNNREEARRSETAAAPRGGRCHLCGGRLDVLVRVEPQTNGQPVSYFACEKCAHVLVRKA